MPKAQPRLLIFVVAYNAETTIEQVLRRIPSELAANFDAEILVIDDASQDRTFEVTSAAKASGPLALPLTVLFNPDNQGYGGNQKIGYHYAIENGFDFVALLHGDGQYAPECLPLLLEPLVSGEADAVFGSRMLERGGARAGGMPLYKFVGNKILTWFQNRMVGTNFSEFHSGYRIYSTAALRKIPFELNTNDFHFDTEIIVQHVVATLRIREVSIPTFYGDEICYVNGMRYAWDCVKTVLKARAQRMNLFYDHRFNCAPEAHDNSRYRPKSNFDSPHTAVLARVNPKARVLDLGCAGGYVGTTLRERNACSVSGVDVFPLPSNVQLDSFVLHDLAQGLPNLPLANFDYVLLLDVIEHLPRPERFVEQLRDGMKFAPDTALMVSTGNIGFLITRLMLLLGQFNYGKRGILDLTHSRLFTFASLRRLFEQGGFTVVETRGIPAPFPLAVGEGRASRFLLRLNNGLIRLWRSLFSYQIFMVVRPRPSLEFLLQHAQHYSAIRGAEGSMPSETAMAS